MLEIKEYYSVAEAAVILGLPYAKVYRLAKTGIIDSETLESNNKMVILDEVLVAYINKTIKVKE